MEPMKVAGTDPTVDGGAGEAELQHLPSADDPVLTTGDHGDLRCQ
jgi:hypothetical protein